MARLICRTSNTEYWIFMYSFAQICDVWSHVRLFVFVHSAIYANTTNTDHIVTMIEWSPVLGNSQFSLAVSKKCIYESTKCIWNGKKKNNWRTNEEKSDQTLWKLYSAHPKWCIFEHCLRMQNCIIEYVILSLYSSWKDSPNLWYPIRDDKICKIKIRIWD